jgi:hypothetical protein
VGNVLLRTLQSIFTVSFFVLGIYQESVGIAKALAAKNGYELDSNQEVGILDAIDC